MRKFHCDTTINFTPVKRSVTMQQLETFFLICNELKIDRHRKYFNITFTIPGTEYHKSVTVKRIPLGYINKFTVRTDSG